jgi:antitoxin ParD1/3/4
MADGTGSTYALSVKLDLSPELEALIHRKVEAGLYDSPSEVVCEALRLFADRDRLREAHAVKLRTALAEGLAQANRGELVDGPKAMADVHEILRSRRDSKNTT